MEVSLGFGQGECRELFPVIPILIDEFEHTLVPLKPASCIEVECLRLLGAYLTGKYSDVVRNQLVCDLSTLEFGNPEMIISCLEIDGHSAAVSGKNAKHGR